MSPFIFQECSAQTIQCMTDDQNMDTIMIDIEWTISYQDQDQGDVIVTEQATEPTGEEDEGPRPSVTTKGRPSLTGKYNDDQVNDYL